MTSTEASDNYFKVEFFAIGLAAYNFLQSDWVLALAFSLTAIVAGILCFASSLTVKDPDHDN